MDFKCLTFTFYKKIAGLLCILINGSINLESVLRLHHSTKNRSGSRSGFFVVFNMFRLFLRLVSITTR